MSVIPANANANFDSVIVNAAIQAEANINGANLPPTTRIHRVVIRTSAFTEHTQIFYVLFRNLALAYARLIPPIARRFIEFFLLIMAFLSLALLVYIHCMFVRSPLTCLDHLRLAEENTLFKKDDSVFEYEEYFPATRPKLGEQWPRQGILRVEIMSNVPKDYSLYMSYAEEAPFQLLSTEESLTTSAVPLPPEDPVMSWDVRKIWAYLTDKLGFNDAPPPPPPEEPIVTLLKDFSRWVISCKERFIARVKQLIQEAPARIESFSKSDLINARYVMEYSMHHGLLRLSPQMRQTLNVSTKLVVLDPYRHKCFGNAFTHILLDEFFGYNDLLIGSLKRLSAAASSQANNVEPMEGYVRNVMDGSYYRFMNMTQSQTSYIGALFAMIIFTFSVSMLLRYSHHQIFIIINDMLRMMETNLGFSIPAAPLMTLVLALIAVETIMSEFFGDSLTAFYVIIIVSLADHYEAVCCHSSVSKLYWPWLFFLYHFSFYAYNYRFNGQYSNLALFCSWLFIQHSMVYFFHHFDLPYLLRSLIPPNLRRPSPTQETNNNNVGQQIQQ